MSVKSTVSPVPRRGQARGRESRRRGLWQRWLRRRLPPTDRVRFDRRNLFIFPAPEGALFLVLLLIMLLTGINYQNSLIYLLTFLLGALFYVGILQTHDNLSGVELTLAGVEEGFAGRALTVELRMKAIGGETRRAVVLMTAGNRAEVHLQGDTSEKIAVAFTPRRRGLTRIPRIQVETRYPLGLFRAWSYVWLKTPILAYPRPVAPNTPTTSTASDDQDAWSGASHQASDELLLRSYRAGDALQRVQWKRFARDEQMVVSVRETTTSTSRWLDYNDFPGADQELRLSYLAWLVEEVDAQGQSFGLRLPGIVLAPSQGEQHRRQALRCLALFGEPSA